VDQNLCYSESICEYLFQSCFWCFIVFFSICFEHLGAFVCDVNVFVYLNICLTKELFCPRFVCSFICLSVGLIKTLWMNFHKMLRLNLGQETVYQVLWYDLEPADGRILH